MVFRSAPQSFLPVILSKLFHLWNKSRVEQILKISRSLDDHVMNDSLPNLLCVPQQHVDSPGSFQLIAATEKLPVMFLRLLDSVIMLGFQLCS
jgi:hypothetical protein